MTEWLKHLISWFGGGSNEIRLTANPNLSNEINKGNKKLLKKQKANNKVVFKNQGNANYIHIEDGASSETIDELAKALIPKFSAGEIIFVEDSSRKLLSSYEKFHNEHGVENVLSVFKPILSQLDYRLLETGLYIRHQISAGENTSDIKSNVVNRYGDRGKNIVNLASAGYFESHLKPFFEELKSQNEETAKVEFLDEFEKIVEDLPFTIFVHRNQDKKDILMEVKEREKRIKSYALQENRIAIHGYLSNADLIESLQEELKKSHNKVEVSTTFRGNLKITKLTIYLD